MVARPSPRQLVVLRAVVVLAVVGLLGAAVASGAFAHLGDPRVLARALAATGWQGQLGFVLAYALLQPFAVPGTVFVFAAPLVWAWPTAFALSMLGTMAASVVGFSCARFLARDWYAARLPQRLRRYDEMVARQPFAAVFMLRLLLWMPQVLHAFLGVSAVPFWTHFWASLLGYAPPLLAVSYLGGSLLAPDGSWQPAATLQLTAWLLLCLLVALAVQRWGLRRSR
jgi:uncharacterized membrane protein YdjX (TVP38/TMEM64 family)